MNQDNPFAKGVSINQDIVMEEERHLTGWERLEKDVDREIAQQVINWMAEEERQVLALGREEE